MWVFVGVSEKGKSGQYKQGVESSLSRVNERDQENVTDRTVEQER